MSYFSNYLKKFADLNIPTRYVRIYQFIANLRRRISSVRFGNVALLITDLLIQLVLHVELYGTCDLYCLKYLYCYRFYTFFCAKVPTHDMTSGVLSRHT